MTQQAMANIPPCALQHLMYCDIFKENNLTLTRSSSSLFHTAGDLWEVDNGVFERGGG